MMKTTLTMAAAALAFAIGGAMPAGAEGGVQAGYLRCDVQGNTSFIFGSSRNLNCTFQGNSNRMERYGGEIKKFGIDIGYVENGVILWAVIAPSSNLGPGTLAGNYAGGTASVAAGYGLGANALIGGSGNSIALQPLSVEGVKGINIAGGVGILSLYPKR
jgi:hypothetical protein